MNCSWNITVLNGKTYQRWWFIGEFTNAWWIPLRSPCLWKTHYTSSIATFISESSINGPMGNLYHSYVRLPEGNHCEKLGKMTSFIHTYSALSISICIVHGKTLCSTNTTSENPCQSPWFVGFFYHQEALNQDPNRHDETDVSHEAESKDFQLDGSQSMRPATIRSAWWFSWNMNLIFPYIGNVIISIDFPIFQRVRSTTSQLSYRRLDIDV